MTGVQAALAREAYAMGWARSGGPMTDRVRAGSVAAVSLALEHAGRPGVMEATALLGHREGVKALVDDRHDRLDAAALAAVLKAWHALVAELARDRLTRGLARRMRVAATDTPDDDPDDQDDDPDGEGQDDEQDEDPDDDPGDDPDDEQDPEELAAIALAALHNTGIAHPTLWGALRSAALGAVRAGWAEGHAGALAHAAHYAYPKRQFDAAAAAAAAAAATPAGHDRTSDIDAAVNAMLAAVAGELGRKLARLDAPSYRTVRDTLDTALGDPVPRAVKVAAGLLTGGAVIRGLLGLFADANVERVEMVTTGGACQACVSTAAEGPFDLADAPTLPLHPWCRCSLQPVGRRYPSGLMRLIRTFLT